MHAMATDRSSAEIAVGIMGCLVGFGVLTFALFPFALPFVLLLAVFTIPLVLVAVVGAFVGGIVAVVGFGLRALGRRARRREDSAVEEGQVELA